MLSLLFWVRLSTSCKRIKIFRVACSSTSGTSLCKQCENKANSAQLCWTWQQISLNINPLNSNFCFPMSQLQANIFSNNGRHTISFIFTMVHTQAESKHPGLVGGTCTNCFVQIIAKLSLNFILTQLSLYNLHCTTKLKGVSKMNF